MRGAQEHGVKVAEVQGIRIGVSGFSSNLTWAGLIRLYRRELVRVYLTNLEAIVRRFTEEIARKLRKLLDDKTTWLRLASLHFGKILNQSMRRNLSRENAGIILRILVKHFSVEKELTSTLMMDSLYAGLKILKQQGRNKEEMAMATLFNLESQQSILPSENDTSSERFSK
ncbi:hypothetical protein EJB05_28522, partial [Eragrostis curvula]